MLTTYNKLGYIYLMIKPVWRCASVADILYILDMLISEVFLISEQRELNNRIKHAHTWNFQVRFYYFVNIHFIL